MTQSSKLCSGFSTWSTAALATVAMALVGGCSRCPPCECTCIGGATPAAAPPSSTAAPAVAREPAVAAPQAPGGEADSNPEELGPCRAAKGQLFGPDYPWNQRVDQAPLDRESAAIIGFLTTNHQSRQRFRVDGPSEEPNSLYGMTILHADKQTPREVFQPTRNFYQPDCDPAPVPLPNGGALEGESGFGCSRNGDCHLLVVDEPHCQLYEMWRANRTDNKFEGGCLALWDLRAPYAPILRGDCCTSADAAGLPIAPLMFTADDIAGGEIRHAIRFILPNKLIRKRVYVRPATHATRATSGPSAAPPYGARMRLKADFDDSGLNPAARVVARALQEYGMILSDGGNITFTAANDRFTNAKWVDVGFGPNDLTRLEWTDFEVVELGERHTWGRKCSCQRTPLTN